MSEAKIHQPEIASQEVTASPEVEPYFDVDSGRELIRWYDKFQTENEQYLAHKPSGYSKDVLTMPQTEFLDYVSEPADVSVTPHTHGGESVMRAAVTFMSRGCSWRNHGKSEHCHMCIWPAEYSTHDRPVPYEHYGKQMQSALDLAKEKTGEQGFTRLDCYNSGSAFDEDEWGLESSLEVKGRLLGLSMKDQVRSLENYPVQATEEEKSGWYRERRKEVARFQGDIGRKVKDMPGDKREQYLTDVETTMKTQWKEAIKTFLDPLKDAPQSLDTIMLESKVVDLFRREGDERVVDAEKLDYVRQVLRETGRDFKLMVAFGLETLDPRAGRALNKVCTEKNLQDLMFQMAERNITTQLYCLDKPFLASEERCVEQAVETVYKIARSCWRENTDGETEVIPVKPLVSLSPTRAFSNSVLSYYPSLRQPSMTWWPLTDAVYRLSEPELGVLNRIDMQLGLSDEGVEHAEGGEPKNNDESNQSVVDALYEFDGTANGRLFRERIDNIKGNHPESFNNYERLKHLPKIERISHLVPVRAEQLKEVMQCEEQAWPADTRATMDSFTKRADKFPEGFFLAYEDFRVAGVLTSFTTSFDPEQPAASWTEKTANGTYDKHDEKGNTLYIGSLGVAQSYQSGRLVETGQSRETKPGIGSTLLTMAKALAQEKNLQYVALSARLPGLAEYQKTHPEVAAEEYIKLKQPDGKYVEKQLRFYCDYGDFSVNQLIPEAMESDAESGNYGAVLVWENPTYQPSK